MDKQALTATTRERRLEKARRHDEVFTQSILNSIAAEVCVLDCNGTIIAVNEPWRRFASENGVEAGKPSPTTEIGANYFRVCEAGDEAGEMDAAKTREGIDAVLEGRLPRFSMDYPCHTPTRRRWFNMTVTPLGEAPVEGAVITHTDISEHKEMEERIWTLAYIDPLTNLPNRRMLLDRLSHDLAQAKRFHRAMAIMFLDLDNFKNINDTLGHDIGDELLKVVAARLNDCVRSGDTVGRQGGDEFVIVLAEVASPGDAEIVATKIIQSFVSPVQVGEHVLKVSTSIGIAVFPVDWMGDELELMKRADMAMYAAKSGGRNCYRFYSE